jgi:hypothetical protein
VAISGETVVVGAREEDSNATGVNGNQSDNSAHASGAAYVFVRSGTSWSQQAYLKASNAEEDDQFGQSVAISGETVVVGAVGERSNATGVNGDQSDNSISGAGAAYVFVRSGTSWSQQAYLKASNTLAIDIDNPEQFGFSVAISGETVVVGAPYEHNNATGVNGNGYNRDETANSSGAAYVFTIPASNTPPGTNVTVQSGNTTITFANVSTAGNTTATPIDPSSAGTLPGGFALTTPPLAFEIQTTATVTGPITICFYVPSVNDPGEFSSLRVLHNEGGTLVDRTILSPDSPAPDFATRTICARVSSLSPFVIARLNSPPVVGAITAPINPTQVNTAINASASFTDSGTSDTHTALWNWGDGGASAGVVTETGGSGSVSGSHTYTAAGVYVVTLTVTDNRGSSGQSLFQYVVIYDPSAGFVTGGGWINSPPGAYVPNPSLTGKANFGFVSKYQNGAGVPTGNTEFQFKAGNLNFKSTSYEWMVISGGKKAQYKGFGTINGSGSYRFMLTAIDGDQPGGGGQDKFRIKIWSDSGGLVYDNQMNDPDSNDPTTVLGGGSIVIHKP